MKRAIHILVILPLFLLAMTVAAQSGAVGTVYQTTNVRGGPDTRYPIVEQLNANERVQIDGRDQDSKWLHVVLPDGKSGWLPIFVLIIDGDMDNLPVVTAQSTQEALPNVMVISYGRVNVRSGPGIQYDIVGQLDVSDQAEAVARSSGDTDWLLIRFNGQEGWVAYFTVNVQGDAEGLPVLVPDNSGQSLIAPSSLLHTRFNVRLHETPELDSAVLIIAPFNSEVTPLGRSPDNAWLLVGYKEVTGWGASQLFDIDSGDMADLPVVYASVSATPEASPAATAQAQP